jgi:hypothetical protein
MLTDLLRDLGQVRRINRRKRLFFQAALAYNRLHTFQMFGMWMCPTCNKVHPVINVSAFSGAQFPNCCEFPIGPRLDAEHATDVNFKI